MRPAPTQCRLTCGNHPFTRSVTVLGGLPPRVVPQGAKRSRHPWRPRDGGVHGVRERPRVWSAICRAHVRAAKPRRNDSRSRKPDRRSQQGPPAKNARRGRAPAMVQVTMVARRGDAAQTQITPVICSLRSGHVTLRTGTTECPRQRVALRLAGAFMSSSLKTPRSHTRPNDPWNYRCFGWEGARVEAVDRPDRTWSFRSSSLLAASSGRPSRSTRFTSRCVPWRPRERHRSP